MKRSVRHDEHVKWLQEATIPIYMHKHYDDIPNSIEYPLEEITEKFGTYFTNTISFMIALALLQGYKVIHVYGVNMAVDSEYAYERPSCEYFVGLARGMGAEVFLHPDSDLCKTTFLYGYENNYVLRHKLQTRMNELEDKQKMYQTHKNNLQNEYKQKLAEIKQLYEPEIVKMDWAIQQCVGAINEAKYMIQSYI
jgi:hypothetical protein